MAHEDLGRASAWMPGVCLSAGRTHSSILPIPLLITHRLSHPPPASPLPFFKQQRLAQTSAPRSPQTHSWKTESRTCDHSQGLRRCMKVLRDKSTESGLIGIPSHAPQKMNSIFAVTHIPPRTAFRRDGPAWMSFQVFCMTRFSIQSLIPAVGLQEQFKNHVRKGEVFRACQTGRFIRRLLFRQRANW